MKINQHLKSLVIKQNVQYDLVLSVYSLGIAAFFCPT